MTIKELRANAKRIMQAHVQAYTANTTAESEAFVIGYLCAARDARAICIAEYEVACDDIHGRNIPQRRRSWIWW